MLHVFLRGQLQPARGSGALRYLTHPEDASEFRELIHRRPLEVAYSGGSSHTKSAGQPMQQTRGRLLILLVVMVLLLGYVFSVRKRNPQELYGDARTWIR